MVRRPCIYIITVLFHLVSLEAREEDGREALQLCTSTGPLPFEVTYVGDAVGDVAVEEDDVCRAVRDINEPICQKQTPTNSTALPHTVHQLVAALAKDEGWEGAGHVVVDAAAGVALIQEEGGEIEVVVVVDRRDHLSTGPGTYECHWDLVIPTEASQHTVVVELWRARPTRQASNGLFRGRWMPKMVTAPSAVAFGTITVHEPSQSQGHKLT